MTFSLKKLSFSLLGTALLSGAFGAAQAAEIKVGQGVLPPYGIKESNSGIEVDIVRAALAKKGHTIVVRFVPFGRVGKDFQDGKIDAANTLTPDSGVKGEYSDSHISYQNVATTLKDSGLNLGSIGDLNAHKVVAFANASIYLGDDFAKMASGNKNYREVADQATQNKLLMTGRTDVVVGDIRIFQFYNKKIADQVKLKDVTYHTIFKPTAYSVAFKDAKIRDDFNAGLKEIKASGEYDQIIAKYVKG
ncbi:substrate-binding periplasmic protein [Sneathiella aquimaris]|uniref:substrate-binding periplasmic protein n=1 Tax=Sneathiella aquimaris TaxID=2599305 RepID=UPI00146BB3C2|nr:transporter substrate-binding domain-containing protein [Sneathiella aquimaris]